MIEIEYPILLDLDQGELLSILNKNKIRTHLAPHDQFNDQVLAEWISSKVGINSTAGCRVRGIRVDGAVAGWCGIQLENESYELAIVLNEVYWGMGITVFKELMMWASELGHSHVVLHLLNTRPEYKFLKKMACRVFESTMFGQNYTSYELKVARFTHN